MQEYSALMSQTRFEWTLVDYAILTADAITVPVYPTSSLEQVKWILGIVNVASTSCQRHERGIHAVSAGPGQVARWRMFLALATL